MYICGETAHLSLFSYHVNGSVDITTVVPAKSDSDVMFVYKVIRDLESIDHWCINPIRRIGLILK